MIPRLPPLALALALLLLGAVPARASLPPWGTGESRGEDLRIHLVTFGPGDALIEWFGHGALVVEDTRTGEQRLYNYGMFSFDSAMLGRYAAGRLEFWVDDAPVGPTLRFYARANRDVRVQTLRLGPERRVRLARALADNVLPENREYLYHHYADNCSTRLRDAIDRALDGQLRAATSDPGRMTLRDHTRRHTAVSPAMSLLLDFLMNDEIDRPIARWEEAFLPGELEAQVADARYTEGAGEAGPLVERTQVVHRAQRAPVPATPPRYVPWLLALGLALGAAALGLARWERRSGARTPRVLWGLHNALLGLVFGLPGTVLLAMWLFTDHTVTYRNENLFLANPLTLLALPGGLALAWGREGARAHLRRLWLALAGLGLLGLALKLLPAFDQDNWRLIALLLPVSLGSAGAFVLEARLRAAGTARAGGGALHSRSEESHGIERT